MSGILAAVNDLGSDLLAWLAWMNLWAALILAAALAIDLLLARRVAARWRLLLYAAIAARLAPPTSLTELAALARRARLFLGSDTGPLHLAAAVGTPCVGLYGPWPAERHGPYGAQHVALQEAFFDGPTRKRRKAPPALMEAITVDRVCEACDQILRRFGRHVA